MEAMRESWTDDRLDDLSAHIDQRFDQVDRRFEQVDQRFERVENAIKELNDKTETLRIDLYGELISIHKTIARIGWAGMTALIASGAGALATVLF